MMWGTEAENLAAGPSAGPSATKTPGVMGASALMALGARLSAQSPRRARLSVMYTAAAAAHRLSRACTPHMARCACHPPHAPFPTSLVPRLFAKRPPPPRPANHHPRSRGAPWPPSSTCAPSTHTSAPRSPPAARTARRARSCRGSRCRGGRGTTASASGSAASARSRSWWVPLAHFSGGDLCAFLLFSGTC